MRGTREEMWSENIEHRAISLLRAIISGAWGGAIVGAICGGLFASVVFLPTSVEFGEIPTLQYIAAGLWWGFEGVLLGALLGVLVGSPTGLLLRVVGATSYAHYVGAVLGALGMSLFCSVGGPIGIIFGVISGAVVGYTGGLKYQSRLLKIS